MRSAASSSVRAFTLDVSIGREPAGVASWWLDFPAVYVAVDPREQPFRIETVERNGSRIVVKTHWRMMGMTRVFDETITVVDPLAFDAQIRMGRADVFDHFRIEGDGRGGSIMRIRTRVEGRGALGRVIVPMLAPALHRFMRRVWRDAARLCAEDGRRAEAASPAQPGQPSAARGP